MKILAAFLATITMCLSVMAAPVTPNRADKEKPYNWQPLIGFVHPTHKMFVDRNNTRKGMSGKTEISYGVLLSASASVVTANVNGKEVSFKSVVRYLMVICSTGIMAQSYDFFYLKDFPTQEDSPIFYIEYEVVPNNFKQLEKTSLIYTTLCATLV